MRIATLGSGSRGNATLVEGGGVRVLVDCGLPAREVERRLARIGVAPQTLDGILLTHEHGDHVKGVGALSRKYRLLDGRLSIVEQQVPGNWLPL